MSKKNIRQGMDDPLDEKYLSHSVVLEDGRKVFLGEYNPHTDLYSGTDETGNKIYVKSHKIKE